MLEGHPLIEILYYPGTDCLIARGVAYSSSVVRTGAVPRCTAHRPKYVIKVLIVYMQSYIAPIVRV